MSQDKLPINRRQAWTFAILGILAGTGTVALFYFFITELNKVFN